MERWAANTLRTLGIILTTGITLVASLLLLLLSWCASQGSFGGNRHPEQAGPYLVGAVVVMILGITIIARLARGIARSTRESAAISQTQPSAPSAPELPDVPIHLSPASRKALLNLMYSIAAALGVGLLLWAVFFSQYWMRIGYSPQVGGMLPYRRYLLITSIVTAVLYRLPYFLLLIRLANKPDRPALAFSLAIPAAMILQSLTQLPMILRFLSYRGAAMSLGPMGIAIAFDILILTMAWRANQQLGYRQPPSSLIVAGVASFAYLFIFGSGSSWLYRFLR